MARSVDSVLSHILFSKKPHQDQLSTAIQTVISANTTHIRSGQFHLLFLFFISNGSLQNKSARHKTHFWSFRKSSELVRSFDVQPLTNGHRNSWRKKYMINWPLLLNMFKIVERKTEMEIKATPTLPPRSTHSPSERFSHNQTHRPTPCLYTNEEENCNFEMGYLSSVNNCVFGK